MTRRSQTSDESREWILTAAAELFAAKGYRQTTFADIAERSGISRGSIPWHFGSKEGLLLAVLERSAEQLQASLGDPADGGMDVLVAGLQELFARPTTKLFATLLVEALEPDSPIRDHYAAIHEAFRAGGTRWLARFTLPAGWSAESLAAVVVGAGIGIHQQWLLAPDRVDLDQSLATLGSLVNGALTK